MSDKIFIGSARIIKTQYGELTKVSFSKEDIDKLKENLSKGWVNLVIKEKRNKKEGKPTHYLEVDTWKPSGSSADTPAATENQDSEDDLPF